METVSLDLPGCKSASQRALILAALAEGPSTLRGLSDGDDTRFLRRALHTLGWKFEEPAPGVLQVEGRGGPQSTTAEVLEIGEGGSTFRFLVPVLAAAPQVLDLHLAAGLRARPHEPLLELLSQVGARLTPTEQGFRLESRGAWPRSPVQVPVGLSSQFFTGFLLASGRQAQTWCLDGPPVSKGYLEMTVDLLRRFRGTGVLRLEEDRWLQQPGFGEGQDFQVPSDLSAVVFFAVAAILLQRPIGITRAWDPKHPDRAVLDFLQGLGWLEVEDQTLVPTGRPQAGADTDHPAFDLQDSPDSGPALAVLASRVPGGLRFRNVERLQFKESDRLQGMEALARLCGARIHRSDVGLRIVGEAGGLAKEPFDPLQDHRLAMAAGLATLGYGPAEILQRDCVQKSFPRFWECLARLT